MPIQQPAAPSFYEAVKHIPHSKHAPYWDIPFAYEPGWAEKQRPKP